MYVVCNSIHSSLHFDHPLAIRSRMQTGSVGIVPLHAFFYEEIDAILGTRTASAPATLLESAADDTVVPTEEDLVPDSPQSNVDAEIEEAISSATTTTSSTPTTNNPFLTPLGTLVRWQSIRFRKHLQRPFSLPKAFSTGIRARLCM